MCKYCDNIPIYPKVNTLTTDMGISIYDGVPSIVSETNNLLVHTTNHIKIDYCPICGNKILCSQINNFPNTNDIAIYTDGAFRPSVNQGGWAFIVVQNNNVIHSDYGGIANVTNNIMELYAVLKGIHYILANSLSSVTIYTDSQYVWGCATQGWKRKKNDCFWKLFDKWVDRIKLKNYTVNIEWLKGHADNKYNNEADKLAVRGSNLIL